jgi:hypothetical protein
MSTNEILTSYGFYSYANVFESRGIDDEIDLIIVYLKGNLKHTISQYVKDEHVEKIYLIFSWQIYKVLLLYSIVIYLLLNLITYIYEQF